MLLTLLFTPSFSTSSFHDRAVHWTNFAPPLFKNDRVRHRPGVNFINVLQAAFAHIDPKSIKRHWGFDWILTLLGSTCVKAVHRRLMKLMAGVNFINVLQAAFMCADPECAKRQSSQQWSQLWTLKNFKRDLVTPGPS
jgi:hypothetical protein